MRIQSRNDTFACVLCLLETPLFMLDFLDCLGGGCELKVGMSLRLCFVSITPFYAGL
jgi:hypothetical protein